VERNGELAHLLRRVAGTLEALSSAQTNERQRCAGIARNLRGTHGCTVAEEIAAAIEGGE
jgi:hypothetical protein